MKRFAWIQCLQKVFSFLAEYFLHSSTSLTMISALNCKFLGIEKLEFLFTSFLVLRLEVSEVFMEESKKDFNG